MLGEFGDDPHRYAGARARNNYAGTSPITRQSGKKKTVHARHVHNDRLLDALGAQAQSALNVSPGARAYYAQQHHRGLGHRAALRQLANRLVGILHGCLKTRTCYDEATAWPTTSADQRGRCCTWRSRGRRDQLILGWSDSEGQLIEGGHHSQGHWFVNAEFVVAAADVLNERVPGDGDPG